ncbi:7964_t:CDS:2, partial [Entrophospora sp. SA101]
TASLIVTVSTAVAIDGPIITTVATDSSVFTSSIGINLISFEEQYNLLVNFLN